MNALGALVAWSYDLVGNKTSQVQYGSFLTSLPTSPGGAPPSPVNPTIYRQITYAYDKDNRLTSTTAVSTSSNAIYTGAYNGSSYQVSASPVNITTQIFYDADGNAWKSVDGNGQATYFFYDALGRKVAQVDPLGYLTTYALDQDGNVVTETQYATALGAGFASGFSAATDSAPPTGTSNAADRITQFTYDKDGRRLTESRLNVAYATVSSGGGLGTGTGTATITYGYNALGEVTSQRQATGDTITYVYDSEGRQTSFTTASYADGITPSTTDTPQTIYYYDGLGDLTRSTVGNVGAPVGQDRVTTYTYGAAGRLASMTDPTGFAQSYAYDADGNLLTDSYLRATSSGSNISEERVSQYDALGRVVSQNAADWNGSAWVAGDASQTQYDAYGEVSAKGVNGLFFETMTYDGAGRLVSSNANNGATQFFVYDADGNQTLQISPAGSSAVSLAGDTLSQAISAITVGGVVAGAYVTGLDATITTYDARDEATSTILPFRQLTSSTTSTLTSSSTYDAFGDVVGQTNAIGSHTSFTFNTLGDQTSVVEAAVSYTDNTGVIHTGVTPTTYAYYDLSGRQVASQDANGNLITDILLAGSGYNGQAAQIAQQFHPDGGVVTYGYDVFGDQTEISLKISSALTTVETRAYDGAGRLVSDTHPTVASTGVALTNYYAYDGLGERLKQWNSEQGSLVVSTTDYDDEGRVISTVDYAGHAATNGYVWSSSLSTAGMGTFGGWTESTTNTSGLHETTVTDAFGRAINGGSDFGGTTHSYAYDAAGDLVSHISSVGENQTYAFFNTGRAASITVGATTGFAPTYTQATYGYDGLGDTVSETSTYYYPSGGCLGGTTLNISYESETATYDALGRVVSITDGGNAGAQGISIAYEYDQNGNVVHVLSNYKTVPVSGGTAANATQDLWYAYDAMNRTVISQGELVNATRGAGITGGYQGTTITYDDAGERTSATTLSFVSSCLGVTTDDVHTEYYGYTADGYLATVQIADAQVTGNGYENTIAAQSSAYTAVTYANDALGRLLQENDYSSSGVISHSRYNIAYNNDGQVTSDQSYQTQSSGAILYDTNTYYYNAPTSNGVWGGIYEGGQLTGLATTSYLIGTGGGRTNEPGTWYAYSFIWGQLSEESQIQYDPNTNGSTVYTTTLTHDANGYLTSASINDGQPHTVTYVDNVSGQVMDRTDSAGPINEYYYLNNRGIGSIGNTGPSQTTFATAISQAISGPATPTSTADFDQNYTELDPTNVDPTAQSYTVQAGDTLQSIAQTLWGDSSLWYLIADDNGLSASSPLAAGQTINIPNDVANIGHTSSTFKPYNANQATGFILPNAAPPPPHHHGGGCGGIAALIVAVVVFVIAQFIPGVNAAVDSLLDTILVPSPLSAGVADAIELGADAFVDDAIGQGVAIAVGAQKGFSFTEAALAGVGAVVGAALPSIPGFSAIDNAAGNLGQSIAGDVGERFAVGAVNGALGSAITQGIGVATGLQKKFDWTSVATAGVESGVQAAFTPPPAELTTGPNRDVDLRRRICTPPYNLNLDDAPLGNQALVGAAALIAGAATCVARIWPGLRQQPARGAARPGVDDR